MSKNEQVLNFHHAQVPAKKIAETLNIPVRTVYRIIKNGRVHRKVSGTPANKKLHDSFLDKLAMAVNKAPTVSIRKHAKALNIAESTCRKGLKLIGKKSLVRPPVPLLTERLKQLRFERCKRLLNRLKKLHPSTVKIFSDKKVFTVDQVYNRRNDRIIVDKGEPATPVQKTKHPASVMMLGVIASDGKRAPPIFFPEGIKVNTEAYLALLKSKVLPWLKRNYPDGNYIWQQDGAPAHTSKKSQEWLETNMPNFLNKTAWPPSSPDLNPLDYSVWSVVESRACKTHHTSVDTLKLSIAKEWKAMTKPYLIKTCQQFRSRLEKVVELKGGLFEK
jgi:hypothetical protein